MTDLTYTDRYLTDILAATDSIVGVGMSPTVIRPSWFVGNYMCQRGFKVVAVNPRMAGQVHFRSEAVAGLEDLDPDGGPYHMLDIFRRSEQVLPIVEMAIEKLLPLGLRHVWMQIGVINHEAADLAKSHGLTVVMNRCPKMEYQRLSGELSRGGIASGIISSRLPAL